MTGLRTISQTFSVSSLEDSVLYYIVWEDYNGVISNIPCYQNGNGKVCVGDVEDPWLTAKLYKKVGNAEPELAPAGLVILRAFDANGEEIEGGDTGFPVEEQSQYGYSSISVSNEECFNNSHIAYVVEFYLDGETLTESSSIHRIKDGADGANGTNPPQYTEEFYAWSNDASTPRVIDPPTIQGSWSTSIPQRGSYAYLWKKIIRHTLIIGSNPPVYQDHDAEYYRMSGENGTSIATKGSVIAYVRYKVEMESDLPTAGVQNGSVAWVESDNRLFVFNYLTQQWTVQITLRQGDLVIFYEDDEVYQFDGFDTMDDYATALDGYAYTDLFNGHLMQWSDEAANWLDLGQFKGEAGKTYYTHIAWADGVTFQNPPQSPATGCLNYRNVVQNSVVGGTTTPPTSKGATKPYMGYRIDEIAGSDSTAYDTYTWQYAKGAQGERGKTGRFYYYGGEWDTTSSDEFSANDSQTPYFKASGGYFVYVGEQNFNGKTMQEIGRDYGAPSSQSANWRIMYDDFKYIITEAIFVSGFAKFGSAIISGDWMLSACGIIYDANGGAHVIDASTSYGTYNINNAYLQFDANYPETSKPNAVNFCPAYCVDMKAGTTYEQNAHIRGEIHSSAGEIGGFTISQNALTNSNPTREGSGSIIKVAGYNYSASVGAVPFPAQGDPLHGAHMSSEFVANEVDTINVAISAKARIDGASRGFALHGQGHISTNGMVSGWMMQVKEIAANTISYISLQHGNIVLLKGVNGTTDGHAYLPALSDVRDFLRTGSQPFAVELTLLFGNSMKIHGYNTSSTYTGDGYPPHLRDNDFVDRKERYVGYGNVVTYLLVWDGTEGHEHYNAWLVSYSEKGF